MNLIQRNPNDPKYQEFHDGEYEYWPTDGSISSKSVSFPAALVSGLELLAAVAAAGLLAVALAVMYVSSSPLAISENSAVINANIYNNHKDQAVVYTLSVPAVPEDVLQEGMLQNDEQTLSLRNLDGGTTYLLKYYDSEQNEVGQFQFTTPGEKQEPELPEPSSPAESIPAATEPASEPADTTEPETEAPDETVPSETEPEGGLGGDGDFEDFPPVPAPAPAPEPEETEPEETEPEETEPEETEPEPTLPPMEAFSPEVEEIVYTDPYDPMDSGNTDDAYFEITEVYVFINVPADHSVTVLQNGRKLENVLTNHSDDGTLIVTVYGNPVHYGETMKTSVTVKSGNNSIEQGSTFTPPYLMKEATLDMVEETADDSTTYTFTITAHTRDGSNEKIVCNAELYTMLGDDPIPLELQETSPGTYVGTYTVNTTAWLDGTPFATIKGYWDKTPAGTYYQETLAKYNPA